jgi:hypothetical protein
MKKQTNFRSLDSLDAIIRVVNEADEALQNKARVIADSAIPEVLAGVAGAVAGGALSFVALINLGSVVGLSAAGITSGLAAAGAIVGGGMVAGITVIAAPAVILGAGAVGVTAAVKRRKLTEKKEELLKAAITKYDAIVRTFKDEIDMTKKGIIQYDVHSASA